VSDTLTSETLDVVGEQYDGICEIEGLLTVDNSSLLIGRCCNVAQK